MPPPSHGDAATADSLAADLGPEVGALLDAARDLASTLELPRLLDLLLEHLGRLVPYRGTAILVVEGEELCFAGLRNPESFSWEEARGIRYPLADFRPVWDRLGAEEPVVVPDVRGPTSEAAVFRRMVGEEALDGALAFIASLMWVPMVVRGQIIGLLSITSPTVDAYGPGDATLALAIARQAAVAIENARLHERARETAALEERRRLSAEVAALLDAARDLASTREIGPLLEVMLDRLKELVDYAGTSIWQLEEGELTFLGFRGPRAFDTEVARTVRFRTAEMEPHWSRLAAGEPIRMGDIRDDSDVARMFRRVVGGSAMGPSLAVIGSLMWVPMLVRDRPIGLLSLTSPRLDAFGERDAELALAIASQAAVAIENARLAGRAREAAVLEERQRLARELHDSVTQSLYGVSLHAEAATRALADGEVGPVDENLGEIRATVREALGEMRLLLFELRPPPLEEHGLVGALRMRLRAVEARSGLTAEFAGDEAARLRPEAERELYRVAQEALNNVLKHAHASRVTVRLEVDADRAVLEVADDGVGFGADLSNGGGFGLPGMRERVEQLGGALRVESAPGAGTRVRAEVPR